MVTLPLSEILLARVFNSPNRIIRNTEKNVRRYLSNDLGQTWKNQDKSRIFNRSVTDGLKIRTKPGHFLKPARTPGQGPKKRTCPGKLGRIVTLLVSELTVNKREVILLGDFNLDLLKHSTHPQTNNFLDVLISHHFLPAILQPTRVTTSSATLIDNIFTNVWPKMLSSSIIVTDISDHLPVIAWFTPQEPKKDGPVLLSTRKINDDTLDQFRYLLSQQDFSLVSEFCKNKDCNNAYATFLDIVTQIYNQSFPLIKKSKKKSSIDQPWMTKA